MTEETFRRTDVDVVPTSEGRDSTEPSKKYDDYMIHS